MTTRWTILFSICFLFIIPVSLYADDSSLSVSSAPSGEARQLYWQKDYFRAITEILRLKFKYPPGSDSPKLDLLLLKSYYQLEDQNRLEKIANAILTNPVYKKETETVRQTKTILALSLLSSNRETEARKIWESIRNRESRDSFPLSTSVPGQINPGTAGTLSLIVPGSGFLLSRQYGKAALSLFLNALFIAGSYHYFEEEQYGISGLLFFFEISWYFGGQNASREAAVNYNKKLINKYRLSWIESKKALLFNDHKSQ